MDKTDLTIYMLHFLRLNWNNKSNLSPYGHWVLIRFIQEYATGVCSLPLQKLSVKIGVQHKKLRKVIEELQQANLLTVSYPEQGKRARVRHIKLSNEYFENLQFNKNKTSECHKRAILKIKQRLALYPMIKKLLGIIETISINTLEREGDLDFHSALLLLTLLTFSNRFGIVMECGNAEIYGATGLKKQSMYKYLHKLMNLQFIRSRAEGSIRNSFILFETPIYSLNLSHPLWDVAATYSRFYIIQYPEKHQFEVKKIADIKNKIVSSVKKEDIVEIEHSFFFDPISYLSLNNFSTRESFIQYQKVEHERIYQTLKDLSNQDVNYLKMIRFDQLGIQDLKIENYRYNNGDGLLQCYLEQHCSEIYSSDFFLYQQLVQSIAVRLQYQSKAGLFANKKYYQENNLFCMDEQMLELINEKILFFSKNTNSITLEESETLITEINLLAQQVSKDKAKNDEHLGIRQASFHTVLHTILDLIAFNQISFFLKIFRNQVEHVKPTYTKMEKYKQVPKFRILPRNSSQTRYSCIFVPDTELKNDEFFLGKVELQNEPSSFGEKFKFISFDSQQIMPSDEELKLYGILSFIESDIPSRQ